ncbi:hypothetical protein TVAGG3_0267910 [Trichomonas vaginalis G3]|uniref:hypothetical protein n=1 Tax=Trichomonas vaginalis (strain ATCC PRA-98 / G3) TaxID=412133 RepID=UPI0021E5C3BB|nr:hypothetical protein TVAGG3_0267910 [Trichomonas vaginalis G3]KAI5525641.1 hypothetical protein TVAGG3_0267910 [Trichomonas vaginalis G3]
MLSFGRKEIPPDKSLKEFVLDFNIHDAYNEHSDIVTNYLIHHISEFLDLILDPNNGSIGINAVLLAANPQINLIKAMTEKGLIFSKITKFINYSPDFSSKIAVRVCSIFMGIIQCDRDASLLIPPFLLNFLRFSDNSGIRSLFEYIFNGNKEHKLIVDHISNINIPNLFISIIEQAQKDVDNDENKDYSDSNTDYTFEDNQYSFTHYEMLQVTSYSLTQSSMCDFVSANSSDELKVQLNVPIHTNCSFPSAASLNKMKSSNSMTSFSFKVSRDLSNFAETRNEEDVAYLICSLLKIGRSMIKTSTVIRQQFISDFSVFDFLLQSKYQFFVNELMLLCNELISDTFCDSFKTILNFSWNYLVEGTDRLTELTVTSLDIIINAESRGIIKFKNDFGRLFEIIIRLCAQFPDSSFVLSRITKLVLVSLEDKFLNPIVFELLIPALIEFANDDNHRASRIHLVTMFDEIKNKYYKSKPYKNLLKSSIKVYNFMERFLPNYISHINRPYGGQVSQQIVDTFSHYNLG